MTDQRNINDDISIPIHTDEEREELNEQAPDQAGDQEENSAVIEQVIAETESAELPERVAELEEQLKRLGAELENQRKRYQREMERRREQDRDIILKDWLKVVDSIELALKAGASGDDSWREGLELIFSQALEVLNQYGAQRIEALGESFDVNLHEAAGALEDPAQPEGTIAEVMATGYLRGDKLLRPAKVIIVKNSIAKE